MVLWSEILKYTVCILEKLLRGSLMINSSRYYIGWDVGGWNCDRNANSRDALVILNENREIVGSAWRGNLRESINEAISSDDWLKTLFELCGTSFDRKSVTQVILAIDTPLAFSIPFVDLLVHGAIAGEIYNSDTNPYLYRETEQYLFRNGLKPLSSIKDMIGSQSTKGVHVLSKFAPTIASCGVWTDGKILKAIEAYPSSCKKSQTVNSLVGTYQLELNKKVSDKEVIGLSGNISHSDERDALICALQAWLFSKKPDLLAQPREGVPLKEGWIFVPKDGLNQN